MKKSNKILVALAFFGLSAVATTTVAQTWQIGATAADNVTATISGSGDNLTLTISGTGNMQDFIYVPNGETSAPWNDYRSNIKTLVINEDITYIGELAFYNCNNLTGTLTIPNSVTYIGYLAFGFCHGFTGALTIPDSVTYIGNNAFYLCYGFTGALTIPNSVTSIGEGTFYYCFGLTGELIIPNSVTSIGNNAFSTCFGLTEVTIPNSVTTIGNSAFSYCSSLEVINILKSAPPVATLGTNVFLNVPNNIPVNVPCGMKPYYQNNSAWSSAFNNFQEPSLPVITVQSNYDEMGSASVTQYPTCTNNQVIIEATANSGYCFIQWNDGITDSQRTIEVTNDTVLIAIFSALPTVTVESNDLTMGSTNITQQPTCTNSDAIIEATANSGYCFVQWSDGITSNQRTVTVTKDTTIIAVFEAVPNITVQSDNIMGIAQVTQQTTCTDNQAKIEASANNGYCFIQWNDGNTNSTRTVLLTSDSTLTAIFSAIPTITVESNELIMGSASVTQNPTCENSEAIIEATANSGYRFVKWNDEDTENPRTVTVAEDITFTAIFESESGIEDVSVQELNIYPNPVKNQLRISNYELQEGDYTIFNITGQAVGAGFKPAHNAHNGETTIDVSHLPSGVYFIKVGNMVGKFIKE